MKHFILLIVLTFNLNLNAQHIDHSIWTTFLQKYVTNHGQVNYKAISANPSELNAYLSQFSEISPKDSWTKNEILAYWINAYNAFTIKLIIDKYPVNSIKDINDPWDKKFILIDGNLRSLNYIEHNVLREMKEPCIHFAINCASKSCPKLLNEAYTADKLDKQLDNAAITFINSDKNQLTPGNIRISKIFKWFSKDFETKGSVIDFINQYAKTKISPKESFGYLDYNWNLNE